MGTGRCVTDIKPPPSPALGMLALSTLTLTPSLSGPGGGDNNINPPTDGQEAGITTLTLTQTGQEVGITDVNPHTDGQEAGITDITPQPTQGGRINNINLPLSTQGKRPLCASLSLSFSQRCEGTVARCT